MMGVWAFKTVLKICCRFSSIYLRTIKVMIVIIATESFSPRDLMGWLDNSDLRDGCKSEKAIEEYFWQR